MSVMGIYRQRRKLPHPGLQTSLGGRNMKQFAPTMKNYVRSLVPFVVLFVLLSSIIRAAGQEKPVSAWTAHDFQFRVLNTTANSGSLWICGTDEAIAVSSDDGRNWDVKHHTPDGNSLLNIDFVEVWLRYWDWRCISNY
jgi:hypothetical protein